MNQAIGIVGCGTIGRTLLRAGDEGGLGVPVAGVTSRTASTAEAFLATLKGPPPFPGPAGTGGAVVVAG